MIFIPVFEEKTLIQTGDTNGNEVIHYPITKTECITDLDEFIDNIFCNDNVISSNNLTDLSVTESKLSASSVTTDKIKDLAVTTAKLADLSVTEGKLATSSVTTTKIKDLAVTSAKLADLSVTESKLATSSVTNSKLGTSAVTTTKIADGSVTLAKLASSVALDSTKFATVVVGTTKSGHTSDDCDFLCTGSSDQTVIHSAISALPASGGKVLLLEGTYSISDSISISNDFVSFCGMGASTVINRGSSSSYNRCVYVSGSYCSVSNIYCTNSYYGIYVTGSYNNINNNFCVGNYTGIYIYSRYSVFNSNIITSTSNSSIYLNTQISLDAGIYNVITCNCLNSGIDSSLISNPYNLVESNYTG